MADISETEDERRRRKNREKARKYYLKNRVKPEFRAHLSALQKASYQRHRAKRLVDRRAAMTEEKRIIKRGQDRAYREKNREKKNAKDRAYKIANPNKWKEWAEKNKGRRAEYQRARQARLRVESVPYRLAHSLRTRVGQALKGRIKSGSAVGALGCSIEQFRIYLESRFLDGMSWENWSRKGWHLDHIRPLASFDLSDPEQFRIAAHFSNYQPLWALDNARKNNRTDWVATS